MGIIPYHIAATILITHCYSHSHQRNVCSHVSMYSLITAYHYLHSTCSTMCIQYILTLPGSFSSTRYPCFISLFSISRWPIMSLSITMVTTPCTLSRFLCTHMPIGQCLVVVKHGNCCVDDKTLLHNLSSQDSLHLLVCSMGLRYPVTYYIIYSVLSTCTQSIQITRTIHNHGYIAIQLDAKSYKYKLIFKVSAKF